MVPTKSGTMVRSPVSATQLMDPAARPGLSSRPRGYSVSSSGFFNDIPMSSFRARARSSGQFDELAHTKSDAPSPAASPPSWWSGYELIPMPWNNPPAKKEAIPDDQTEEWVQTRKRVAQAASSVLGTAGDIAHEVLAFSVPLLQFAPVPGLQEAARMLLDIWDTVQLVDMSRLACLRLTERCADTLISVQEEVTDASESVERELAAPIAKLTAAFIRVHSFLQKQCNRPFLKRYLKRDEFLKEISGCDEALADALGMFSISVQIRILKQVQASEAARQADTRLLLSTVMEKRASGHHCVHTTKLTGLPASSSHQSLSAGDSPGNLTKPCSPILNSPMLLSSPSSLNPSQILPVLRKLHSKQNHLDAAHDTDALRTLMRAAVQTSSDAEMLDVLQVGRAEMPEALKTLQRAFETIHERNETRADVSNAGNLFPSQHNDTTREAGVETTLHQEFLESGIDALRRMSRGGDVSLPSWTITRYEIDREEKIGIGFFSDVYKGTWRGRAVAIKVLAESTPRRLFIQEAQVWKKLHHPNVLELYGASSASGDPPWFFVSPYERNGNLVEYLKRLAAGVIVEQSGFAIDRVTGQRKRASTIATGERVRPDFMNRPTHRKSRSVSNGNIVFKCDWELFRFIHEIASGMDYLHKNGVLHGDLKAANVLVDDKIRCIISDFGQSEMKSEAYRISGTPVPRGTLRWQAPELMLGQSVLTAEIDIYAFAISCVEILTMGCMPWPLMDDNAVRYLVLHDDQRPEILDTGYNTPDLQELLRVCWCRDPSMRPSFSKILLMVDAMCKNAGQAVLDGPLLLTQVSPELRTTPILSPDMNPSACPFITLSTTSTSPGPLSNTSVCAVHSVTDRSAFLPSREDTVGTVYSQIPEPVFYTPSAPSRGLSTFIHSPASSSEEMIGGTDYEGSKSPPPPNEWLAESRNERRYRMLLDHEYHPSLTLPLWSPSEVNLCDVGYLDKSTGSFVTLFNSLDPEKSSQGILKDMASLRGYGKFRSGYQRQEKRNAAQRGLDAFVGLLTFRNRGDGPTSKAVSRRYSFQLRSGHKAAHLCTEKTTYRYVEKLDTPKKWFKANIDDIMAVYGTAHCIQKEDLFLVIGTLDASDYALFVSHNHPNGQAHFNVFSSAKTGNPWGTFTTDTALAAEFGGPSYCEPEAGSALCVSKVSNEDGPRKTVLVAKLRFKPDVLEPTSL